MHKKSAALCPGLLLCLILAAWSAPFAAISGGKNDAAAKSAGAGPENALRIEFQAGTVGSAEIENGPAELSYSEFRLSARYRGFNAGYEMRHYSWNRTDGLPFAPGWKDPFNEMHTAWLGYERKGRITEKWGWRAIGRLSSSFEDDIAGAPDATLGGMLSYSTESGLILMAGLFGSYNEADQFIMPMAGLLYRPGAKDGFSGSLGFPFSRLSYRFTEKFTLTFRTGFIRRTYKLADDNPVRAEGEFRTSEYSAGLAAGYAVTKRLRASIGADYLFNREITFFEDGGQGGVDYDLENTWGGWARISFSF